VPIAGSALLPLMAGLPPLMLPVHVVLTEMVIDPLCSLAFEGAPAEPDLMDRPADRAGTGLLDRDVLLRGFAQGAALLATTLTVYVVALAHGLPPPQARALGIVALTAGNLGLAAVDAATSGGWRSLLQHEYRAFWIVALAASLVVACGLFVPGARDLLHFEQPPIGSIAATLALVALVAAALSWRPAGRRARDGD